MECDTTVEPGGGVESVKSFMLQQSAKSHPGWPKQGVLFLKLAFKLIPMQFHIELNLHFLHNKCKTRVLQFQLNQKGP